MTPSIDVSSNLEGMHSVQVYMDGTLPGGVGRLRDHGQLGAGGRQRVGTHQDVVDVSLYALEAALLNVSEDICELRYIFVSLFVR